MVSDNVFSSLQVVTIFVVSCILDKTNEQIGVIMGGMTNGVVGLIIGLFLFVLAILWFFLPFAIFGTKDKLDKLIMSGNKTNHLLTEILELSKRKQVESENLNTKPVDYIKLMVQYGIEKNGNKYTFLNEDFSDLKDAVKFAKAKSQSIS